MNLTPKQLKILNFISDFRDRRSYSPTLEEIANAFGVSKITVLQHLRAMEKRGAIRRARYQARAIEICRPADRRRSQRALPLVGTIAAGEPIEALEQPDTLDLDDVIAGKTDPFLLRVNGDSMIEEQIRDGDYVICERRATARNGETVVALLENDEATLKKFYVERNGRVRLQPAHPTMKPLYPKQINIQGVVIGVLRKY